MLIKLGRRIYQNHEKWKIKKDKIFKFLVKALPDRLTANQVTLFRFIILLIWLPFAIFKPSLIQAVLFFVIGFFDLLDGAVARFKNQATHFGRCFDVLTDKFNHVAVYFVFWGITNHQLTMLKFFIVWDLLLALYLIIEYISKNDKLLYNRAFWQVSVRTILWLGLIYEIILVYGDNLGIL